MRVEAISFPYWENAARLVEDWLALLLVFSLILIIFPIVCTVIYGMRIIRFIILVVKSIILVFMDKREKRKYDEYMLEHGEDGEALTSSISGIDDEIF